MARCAFSLRFGSFFFALSLAASALAVQPTEKLLPATTKGYVSTHDVDEVRAKFNESELGKWVSDPLMQPFVEDLKKQIGSKLEKAGKRLGVKWDDLEGVYGGEVALAIIQPDPKDKMSHATALIVDITGKKQQADQLLAKIDANQKANRAVRSSVKAGGVEMVVYTQPLAAGETKPETAYYYIKDDQLIAADHLAVATEIAGRFGGAATDALAAVPAFKYSMQRNTDAAAGNRHHIRWFIEPFGYTEVSRAVQGGRKKRGTDMLKVLQAQGFSAIQGLGGYVFFSTGSEEVLHRTYIYAPPVARLATDKNKDKYNLAMRMLDFPNGKNLQAQPWALPDVASYLTFNWKMKPAFFYAETLVDAIAGDKGVFKEVLLSLKTDPNGPQIDIERDLIDHLGERATMLADVKLPVGLKSERVMVLVEVSQPQIVAKTVEKAFKNDPAAKKRVFRGHTIWEITQEEGLTDEPELMIEGAGFVSKEEEAEEDDGPVLPNMAITVFQGHLVVSTHVDYIEDLLAFDPAAGGLGTMKDYTRVETALNRLGGANDSFRYFMRTEESYRGTYELLQQGKLPEAETMLARLLNGMLGNGEEGMVRKSEIDGSKLPPFESIKKYLGPGGFYVQSEDNGWWLVGCLLKKEAK